MAQRSDVGKRFGVIYTCRCGWIDRGHSSGVSTRPNVGAESLWNQIQSKTGKLSLFDSNSICSIQPCFISQESASKSREFGYKVTYRQDMSKTFLGFISAGGDVTRSYLVRFGLSRDEMAAVALGIFQEVSKAFEGLQDSFPYNLGTSSGFSVEDLVSNLVGFYSIVDGVDYLNTLCQPVSETASLEVWDNMHKEYKQKDLGEIKNKTFRPRYFNCSECKTPPYSLPDKLTRITPAINGLLYRDWSSFDESSVVTDRSDTVCRPPRSTLSHGEF